MRKLIQNVTKWSRQPEVRSHLHLVRKGLRLASEIGKNIPTKEDGKWVSTLKLIGLADIALVTLESQPEQAFRAYRTKMGLTEMRSDRTLAKFLAALCANKQVNWESVEINTTLTCRKIDIGSEFLLLTPDQYYEWGSEIYFTPGLDFNALREAAWTSFDNHIDIILNPFGNLEGFDTFGVIDNPLYGEDSLRMEKLVADHRHSQARTKTRTYMFYGPPGAGKTSFGQAFAERIGARLIRLSASALGRTSMTAIVGILKLLHPDVLLIDDIDKGMSAVSFLELLSALKVGGGIAAILTANTITDFDKGLLRPGRIDTWLEFNIPSSETRRTLLEEYVKADNLHISAEDLASLIEATNGLTQDYVREAASLLAYTDVHEVLAKLESQRKLLAVNTSK